MVRSSSRALRSRFWCWTWTAPLPSPVTDLDALPFDQGHPHYFPECASLVSLTRSWLVTVMAGFYSAHEHADGEGVPDPSTPVASAKVKAGLKAKC